MFDPRPPSQDSGYLLSLCAFAFFDESNIPMSKPQCFVNYINFETLVDGKRYIKLISSFAMYRRQYLIEQSCKFSWHISTLTL